MNIFSTILALASAAAVTTAGAHEGCASHKSAQAHGCRQAHNHAHAHAHEHGHVHDDACHVEVSESALASMKLTTVHPVKKRLHSTVSLRGRMELASDARKDAPSPVAGRMSMKVRELDMVKKGDALFTVDSPAIRSISHEISVLESRLLVYRKLQTTNAEIASRLEVKKSEKSALIAGAEEHGGVITVRAAADGMVEKVNVPDGAWVETGSAVVRLVNRRALRFRALTAASEAAKLRDGMKVIVNGTDAELRIGAGDNTGITPVYAVFKDGTAPGIPGIHVTAECETDGSANPVTALPEDCVVKTGAESMVFLRDHERIGRFIAVKVETGISNGGWTEIKGLPECGHTEVVKNGAYELKLALAAKTSGSKPVGHFHADGTFHEGEH